MRAEIASFEWPDLERDGVDGSALSMTSLVFIARPLGSTGGETFQVRVCTPVGLNDLLARDGVVVGRHLLFVSTIDIERIEASIRDRLRRLDADTWRELAEKIGRIGYWEFEDYTESR
jgi:hypothetical protein